MLTHICHEKFVSFFQYQSQVWKGTTGIIIHHMVVVVVGRNNTNSPF